MTEPAAEWNCLADDYDRLQGDYGDPYRRLVVDPALFDLLGDIDQKTILDAGCGNGYLAHQLAQRGAEVTSFDGSASLIALAQKRFPNLTFQCHNFLQVLPYPNRSFDTIVSHLVFQDLADLARPLGECQRLLKPSGRLVVSTLHPCFAYPATRAIFPLINRLRHRSHQLLVDNYRKEGVFQSVIPGLSRATTRYHRRLSTYLEAFKETDWQVRSIVEPIKITHLSLKDKQALASWPIPPEYLPVYFTQAPGVPLAVIFELIH